MKKLNNSGFSLIELIIVMAIMAILTVAVAPQYLKYVERSKKSVDVQTMATVVSAIQIYAADPMADSAVGDSATIKAGETTTIDSTSGYIEKALENAGISEITLKSKEWSANNDGSMTLKVTVDSDSVPTVTVEGQKSGLDIIKGVTESTTDGTSTDESQS